MLSDAAMPSRGLKASPVLYVRSECCLESHLCTCVHTQCGEKNKIDVAG